MTEDFGSRLRNQIAQEGIVPLVGVYDVFSASIAAKYFDGIFLSGFSFAASHYGLPDIGFIAWSDMVEYAQRVRTILPRHHIVVDIDDGYCDPEVACHVVALLENIGVSGVIIEDQKRPRRCGHLDDKSLLELGEFLEKLDVVLKTRGDMYVIARTDATELPEITRRVEAFSETGVDAILVDGIRDLTTMKKLSEKANQVLAFNQIAGGKSPACTLEQLRAVGVGLVNYSTPCLFAAQTAIEHAMEALRDNDGRLPLPQGQDESPLVLCCKHLQSNLSGRKK